MSFEYQRVPDLGAGLRLHLNENVGGCSPAVLRAVRALDETSMATYPTYERATGRCAEHLGVPPDEVLLTNGLDDGIMAACVAAARERVTVPESIVVEPAFDMYAACTDATGGRVATIRPRPDLAFPIDELLAAIGPATRLVFLTSPNNPTGHLIDPEAIDRIAEAARHATVFLDEAYGDFGGTTFIGRRADHPNVLVGRTFAKAYGLAALRIGAVVGDPERLAELRRSVTPYGVNICAMVGLEAALRDREHVERYVSDVRRSRRLLYDACTRWRVQYWESAANFVLVKIGARASEVVRALAGRGIFIRDRSAEPGCDGCVRITTGRVQDTEACIAALDDIIQTEAAPCAAP